MQATRASRRGHDATAGRRRQRTRDCSAGAVADRAAVAARRRRGATLNLTGPAAGAARGGAAGDRTTPFTFDVARRGSRASDGAVRAEVELALRAAGAGPRRIRSGLELALRVAAAREAAAIAAVAL